jgi:hypothetical protein
MPPQSQENYYQGIIDTARGLGFTEPAMLLGLLWHAPHGDARQNLEKREYFQKLINQTRDRQAGAVVPALPARMDQTGGPEAGFPASPPGLDVLDLFSRPGPPDPAAQEKEAVPGQFDQSISGQFFQLLAGLGEKVIMESCRYEAMLTGVRQQAGEIDNLVSQWEKHFASGATGSPETGDRPGTTTVELNWDALVGQNHYKKQHMQEIQSAAHDFLHQNRDLAADGHKIQMVVFCLKNYVSINPENAALPFREKLNQAGSMAREFFRMRGEL